VQHLIIFKLLAVTCSITEYKEHMVASACATVLCYTFVVHIVVAGLISLRNLGKELMEKFSWGSTKKQDKR
jgi:hypothetical protein